MSKKVEAKKDERTKPPAKSSRKANQRKPLAEAGEILVLPADGYKVDESLAEQIATAVRELAAGIERYENDRQEDELVGRDGAGIRAVARNLRPGLISLERLLNPNGNVDRQQRSPRNLRGQWDGRVEGVRRLVDRILAALEWSEPPVASDTDLARWPGKLKAPTLAEYIAPLRRRADELAPASKPDDWSAEDSPKVWAKRFGISPSTFRRRARAKIIRIKAVTSKRIRVHRDDLPTLK